jgi:DNA-binding PadR family transcriptional regulator
MHHHHHFYGLGPRGRGRHGEGGWGRGGGGRFWDRDGDWPGARKLSAADLQLVILALLEQAPAHGYELIKALEARSGGFYTPSPGVIYPALTYLDEVGYAEAEAEGTRKLYRITEAGCAQLDAHRQTAQAILDALERIGGRMEQVREAFGGWAEGQGRDGRGPDVLHAARHALRDALAHKRGCGPEEAARIAHILTRAAEEIRSGSRPADA